MNIKLEQWLEAEDACSDARNWLEKLDPDSFADAWDACPEDEWKVWAAEQLEVLDHCTCEDGDCDGCQQRQDPDLMREAAIAAFDKWKYKPKPHYNRDVTLTVTVSLKNDNTATPADVALSVYDLLVMYAHPGLSGVAFTVTHDDEVE